MQNRMKEHPLTNEQIDRLLTAAHCGTIAVNGPDGYPYSLPLNFVYVDGKIYFHGLPRGTKLDLIAADPKVSFCVYDYIGLIRAEDGCGTNVEYTSVTLVGNAKILTDLALKEKILDGVVAKYTPEHAEAKLPENMIKGTGVVEITITKITGKFYK